MLLLGFTELLVPELERVVVELLVLELFELELGRDEELKDRLPELNDEEDRLLPEENDRLLASTGAAVASATSRTTNRLVQRSQRHLGTMGIPPKDKHGRKLYSPGRGFRPP